MVCLMMPSFAGATWADVETYDYVGVTKECLIDMDIEALRENIEYAISYNVQFNSSVMKFDSEDEELVKQYEALFSSKKNEEPLYYVDYDFGENVLPAGAKVSVFARKQKTDAVEETKPAETEASKVSAASPAEAATTEWSAPTESQEIAESETVSDVSESESTQTDSTEETTQGAIQIEMLDNSEAVETSEITTVQAEEQESVTEPTDSVEPIDSTEPTESKEPTESTELTETSESTETSEPTKTSLVETSSTATASPTVTETSSTKIPDVTETAAVAKENDYENATGSNADEARVEDYKITGNEEIILLFQNKSIDDYIFQVRIGNRQTGKIYVPSATVLLEETNLEKKRLEALEALETLESVEGAGNLGGGAGGAGGGGGAGGSGNGSADSTAESIDKTVTDATDTVQTETNDSAVTESDNQNTENENPESGDISQGETGDNQSPEKDAPKADDNSQAPESNAPEADNNNQAPEVNAPEAANDNQAPEANEPEAANDNAPAEGLEVSISNHQVPRVAAPVAGEVNDEDFENRPGADSEEEVSYEEGYVASTDPNEELGMVLEALIYKEKSKVRFYSNTSSVRSTSGASVSFLMSEIGSNVLVGTGGSLTIRKQLDDSVATQKVEQGTEYTYDVKITGIAPTAEVTLDGTRLSVSGGSIHAQLSIPAGQSKTFEGLTSGSQYTVTQIAESQESAGVSDEVTIEGGTGTIDYETNTVTGVIETTSSLGEGEIVWDKSENAWYDEGGTRIDIDGLLGGDFQWYEDYWNSGGTVMFKKSTAELLASVKNNAEKITFNINDGGIDIFYGKSINKKDDYNKIWYAVMKTMYGRQNCNYNKNFYSKETIEEYLGDHLIEWEYDSETGADTTLVYYTESWRVRPAGSLENIGAIRAQSVVITYTGGYTTSSTNLVLRKQLVTSPENSAPQADDENQTFLYRIENRDETNTRAGEEFYASITIEKGQTEGSCTLTNVPISSQYVITELDNLRYLPVGGPSRTVNPMESEDDIIFTGYKAYTGYFSDTNVIINRVTPVEPDKFQLTTEYPDGQPLNLNIKITPPPALVPDKDKSGMGDGGDAEMPAA